MDIERRNITASSVLVGVSAIATFMSPIWGLLLSLGSLAFTALHPARQQRNKAMFYGALTAAVVVSMIGVVTIATSFSVREEVSVTRSQ